MGHGGIVGIAPWSPGVRHRNQRGPEKSDPGHAGVAGGVLDTGVSVGRVQNVMLQRLSVPVSAAALSDTRRFQVPFLASLDRFTV